jgi:hypothetical protein
VLTHILAELEQQERLGSCALVCRSWRAAAAATSNISVWLEGLAQLQQQQQQGKLLKHQAQGRTANQQQQQHQLCSRRSSFVSWLQQHGQCETQLELRASNYHPGHPLRSLRCGMTRKDQELVELPLLPLQQMLHLSLLDVKLAPLQDQAAATAAVRDGSSNSICSSSSGSCTTSVLSVLSGLTHLTLDHSSMCSCSAAGVGLCCLQTLAGLRSLNLSNVCAADAAAVTAEQQSAAVAAAMSHLQQVTRLQVSCTPFGNAGVAALSSMQQLQWLDLSFMTGVTAACCSSLPSSLTKLQMYLFIEPDELAVASSSSSSGTGHSLAHLKQLKYLELHYDDPALLIGLQQLTHLDFCLQELTSARLKGLCTALAGMQQLQELCIQVANPTHQDTAAAAQAAAAAATAAAEGQQYLTAVLASSQLTSLTIHSDRSLPISFCCMFSAGLQHTALQYLSIQGSFRGWALVTCPGWLSAVQGCVI